MSWERIKYEAHCDACGQSGYCVSSSDDWGRSETYWFGFTNIAPSSTEVGRKKAGARDHRPACKCGSREISSGKYLGEISSQEMSELDDK